MKVKNILVILGGLLLPLYANANRVAILDEGFNPNFPNTSVVGRQGCFSNSTIILQDAGTVNVEFLTASLCRNGLQVNQGHDPAIQHHMIQVFGIGRSINSQFKM